VTPSLAQVLVAPILALACVVALAVGLFALADAAGKRAASRRARSVETERRRRIRRREAGLGSWEWE
jgi:hypothetical protein